MVDYRQTFVSLLKQAVNDNATVCYELFIQPENTPCVSYLEIGNVAENDGDTIRHSRITFQVKVYDKSISTVASLATQIDNFLVDYGFRRTGSVDMIDNGNVVNVLTFQGTGFEVDDGQA